MKSSAFDWRQWTLSPVSLWGAAVTIAVAAYYYLFYFPPRLVGSNEPDRFYHLAISKLMASDGLLRTLPQVEDLNWGRYFPDKEFLFHVLTGGAYWLAGPVGVHLVVPMLGIAIVVCLYWILSRVLVPWRAAVITLAGLLLCPVFIFRITLLRPHLLAILCFCLLLAGILRGRPWLAALAAAGFAFSYHAFYIPMLVILVAAAFAPKDALRAQPWTWAAVGLALGVILNPYFPSTLVMSFAVIKIALGVGLPPGLRSGNELLPLGFEEYLAFFGFLPLAVLATGALVFIKRMRPSREFAGFWFLFALSILLTLLSMKSARAIEYAVPTVLLLVGYALSLFSRVRWVWLTCLALVVTQGATSWTYYYDIWNRPQEGNSGWYLSAIDLLPPEAEGQKVFNCEWEAGSYLLFARPGVRFVDVLEPALLWQASPEKYVARERLLRGLETSPRDVLRQQFGASFVLCATKVLNEQMAADRSGFQEIPGDTGPLRVFRVLR